MNRRFRVLAALLALVAFSAYFAEGVWASLCPPGMDVGSHVAADVGASAAHQDAHAGMHHAPAPDSDESDPSRSDTAPCPLGMPGAGSSCVAVSLPAVATVVTADPVGHAALPSFFDSTHDQLLAVGHFRPPRA